MGDKEFAMELFLYVLFKTQNILTIHKVYCCGPRTKLNFSKKAFSVVCGIGLMAHASRAGGVDSVLAAPSGAPYACKGRVQALQLPWWLVLAG